jgi:hypothetical protein
MGLSPIGDGRENHMKKITNSWYNGYKWVVVTQ